MIDFNFEMKTELYFGKGKAQLVGEILHTKNAKTQEKIFVKKLDKATKPQKNNPKTGL